jgi:hypothetical protein
MIRAAALIAGPLLLAAVVFQIRAPGRNPGVYVEVESRSGGGGSTYAVPGYPVGDVPIASDVAMNTLAVNGVLRSFFIVDPGAASVAVSPTSTQLYFLVMNHADEALRGDPRSLPSTIRRINPRVYRVTSPELEPNQPLGIQYYRQVLARAAGSRAAMDLVVALVVQDSTGQRRMYSVRVGPGLRDLENPR